MSHEKWEDENTEDLLSKVPKIHDQRSKEDVFNRLKNDGLFDDEPINNNDNKVQRRKFRWMPIVVSIAAVFLLAILIPSVLKEFSSSDSAEQSEMMDMENSSDMGEMKISESTTEESESSISIMNTEVADIRTAVYPDELEGNTLFQLGLASEAADSLPISVLIPNDRIQQEFGEATPTAVELYNHFAPLFNESAIGFTEYHPYAGTITEAGERVIHTIPSNHPYEMGSASLTTYLASLVDTFGTYYEEAELLNEEGTAFEFSQVGEPSAPIILNNENTQYNYFKYTQSDGNTYLTPNFREAFSTVDEAITAMKEETNDVYQSVIIPNVDYSVSVEDQLVIVKFTEEIDLNGYDQVQAMQMIEGILLTAANFDATVRFENVSQTEWQGFDFSTALPKPVGPNEIPFEAVFQ